MISKQVAMTFYYGDPELEINRTKPTPSSPVSNPHAHKGFLGVHIGVYQP